MTTENWTKSEPRLILERPCPCALDWCPGVGRIVLDPDRQIHLEGATGRGFDALISDIIDALLSEEEE